MKRFIKKKDKTQTPTDQQEDTNGRREAYRVTFLLKKDIDKEIRGKYPKKLYTLEDAEEYIYVLLGVQKIPSPEAVAFGIYDIQKNEYSNGIIPDKKNYIVISGEKDGYLIEYVSNSEIDAVGISEYAEEYFGGYPYRICETAQELKGIYSKRESMTLRIILVSLLLISLSAFLYLIVFDKAGDIQLRPTKPPKPTLPAVTALEKNNIRRDMSEELLLSLIKEAKNVAESKEVISDAFSTRIVLFSINNGSDVPKQEPFYDETAKRWVYTNPAQKRGGYQVTVQKGFEKKYAEKGYVRKEDGIYYKGEDNLTIKYYNPDHVSEKGKIPYDEVDIACIYDLLILSNIKERKSGDITFELAQKLRTEDTLSVVLALSDIIGRCPVYIDRLNLSDTDKSGMLHLYYKFKE